eukprot:gene2755-5425_t
MNVNRGWLMRLLSFLFLLIISSSLQTTSKGDTDILNWLQSQSGEVAAAQNSIRSFLHSRRIPVGSQPRSLLASNTTGNRLRIALCDDSNEYECRISLGKASYGRKVVAPCGCTGSQEWVQFSELNRMRRRDPSQWMVCQTCQQRFDYDTLQLYGGLGGNLISSALDHRGILRSGATAVLAIVLYLSSGLITRFLTSRMLWQLYPKWCRLIHLPLVLMFWGGKIVFSYLLTFYLELEKVVLNHLTELETSLIEPNLPLTN